MSKGIGRTQRAILDALAADADHYALTVVELADRIGCGDRQIRTAVRALEHRELVVITKEHGGWRGVGEYGRLAWNFRFNRDPTDADPTNTRPANLRVVYYQERAGMPTGASLFVWLPDQRQKYLDREPAWVKDAQRVGELLGK